MKKILSQIVIFLLLVIAPVSFSTAEIPNFDVPATKTNQMHESRKVTIGVIRQSIKPVPSVVAFPRQCFVQIPTIPAFDRNMENLHGRSPLRLSSHYSHQLSRSKVLYTACFVSLIAVTYSKYYPPVSNLSFVSTGALNV